MVHLRRCAARADGPGRGCPPIRDRDPQHADRQHPSVADLVLPASWPAPAHPDRWASLPVRPVCPDQPSHGARPGPGGRSHRRGAAQRGGHSPYVRPRGLDRRARRRPGDGLPGGGQLLQRPGAGDREPDGGGSCGRGRRRLGPGPCRGQHRARPARLGRRLRRLVHLQVPQRRPGCDRVDLRPRAPRPGPGSATPGGLVGPGSGAPLRDGRTVRPRRGRRRLEGVDQSDPLARAAGRLAGHLRRGWDAGPARPVRRDPHPARAVGARRPAVTPIRCRRGGPGSAHRPRGHRRLPRARTSSGSHPYRSTTPTTRSGA